MKSEQTIRLLYILFLPQTVWSVHTMIPACPFGFNYQNQCSCYQISFSGEDRTGARQACEGLSSHLVFIESEQEQQYLVEQLSYAQFYWIGLNGLQFEDKLWDDESPATFTNFYEWTNPFGDNSGCYKIVSGGFNVPEGSWHDDGCFFGLRYICEYEDVDCNPVAESGPADSCPSNTDESFGCSCYKLKPQDFVNRETAKQKCEAHSGYHLVFIESEQERNFLAGTYDRLYDYWLGVNGLDFEAKTWDDGTELTYNNFGDDIYTFNDNSGCYRIVPDIGGFQEDPWQDWSCLGSFGYICEYETSCSQEITTVKDHIETTSLPASTESSTQKHTSQRAETTAITTSEQMASTHQFTQMDTSAVVVTTVVTTSEQIGIDVGVFFGLPPSGKFIHGDSVMISIHTVRTVTRCSVQCVQVHCNAFLYIQEDASCSLALENSSRQLQQAYKRSTSFVCSSINRKLLCTSQRYSF